MQHLEDGYLHEIADGEVPSEELVAVREHLDGCESCRARLDQARLEAETARDLVELIEVPELALMDAPLTGTLAEPASSMLSAPLNATARAGELAIERASPAAKAPGWTDRRWVRTLAWAASLVLAAGIGYMTRGEQAALLSTTPDPVSIGRLDSQYLNIPAQQEAQGPPAEADRVKAEPQPDLPAAAPPARQNAAGARAEAEQSPERRAGLDTAQVRRDELQVTSTVADAKKTESKDADAKLAEVTRERAASDARDQAKPLQSNRPQPAAPSVAGATAENRFLAKAAPEGQPTIISFPRAIELLGGRIKLIEGMVPARLEAVGRTVRVIYVIDEGNLVLAQVAAVDSLNWHLSGPLPVDSLASLRLRVR